MATLPRVYNAKYKPNVSAPFSSSPKKLQEMSLPAQDGHDGTASGVSLKQYEEQLSGLRKENFNLKLRIYFLEEKLGSGAPPAVQGLLEHNVRLQVEVEELRRQLTDKQELLAVAAEAIDVLEQQGSMSTDSIDGSMNISTAVGREVSSSQDHDTDKIYQTGDDTCQELESIGDTLGMTVNNDLSELARVRREYRKALIMLKGCFKKIQQQEKDLKKLKMRSVLNPTQVTDQSIEKYEEELKCKDEYIRDLENRVKDLQNNIENGSSVDSGNLQELLTRRLQGLAYFLDKLLSHKCVLGEDKKKLAESILEQSLALPVGLKLDESMAPEDFTMDESNLDMSHSLKIEDLTMMFGHHVNCNDSTRTYAKKQSKQSVHPQADFLSESECWSEPDRNVSLARIGILDVAAANKEVASENTRHRSRRSRVSYGSRSDETKPNDNEKIFVEEIHQLTQRIEHLEIVEYTLSRELTAAKDQIVQLTSERESLTKDLDIERSKVQELNKSSNSLKLQSTIVEERVKELEQLVAKTLEVSERLRTERQELETTFMETERSLRRAADEATVQASQAALERARAQHDRLRVERELEDTREKLNEALNTNSELRLEISNRITLDANDKVVLREPLSEEDRPTSPDQGIDSDRLSSLENNDSISKSPRSLYDENMSLREKLARTKATLADTLTQLNAANMRKKSVQRAICREIHKTHGVLRKARDQFENLN